MRSIKFDQLQVSPPPRSRPPARPSVDAVAPANPLVTTEHPVHPMATRSAPTAVQGK